MKKAVKEGTVIQEELPELLINCKNAVAVTDIYQFKGHTGSAFHGIFIPAGVSQISFFPASLPFFEASVIIVFILV